MPGHELSYAVRLRVVARFTGQMCLSLAALTGPPLLVSVLVRDTAFAWRAGVTVAGLAGAGWFLARRGGTRDLQWNEAAVVVAAGFLIAPAAMVFPFMSAGLPAADAFFEAVSGVTTTGLSLVPSVSALPASVLFARAWMQWYGGLGIVILSLLLVMRPGIQAHRILAAEDSGEFFTDIVGSTRAHARRMCLVYLTLTAVGFVALLLTGAGLFSAVVHTLSAVSTGGFATSDRSLAGLPSPATRWVALALGLAGALPFALYYALAQQRRWRQLVFDPEVIALLTATAAVAALLALDLHFAARASWAQALDRALATALSAQSTTGFAPGPLADLPAAAKLVLIVSMFTGGCLGSTAGGVKWLRLVLLFQAVGILVARSSLPAHAVLEPRVRGHRVSPEHLGDAALIFVLFLVTMVALWLVFVAAGHAPLDSLFDVVSATGTVGLSTGVVGPDLALGLKLLLCAGMLLGRLEIVAFLVLLYPYTWWGKRRRSR